MKFEIRPYRRTLKEPIATSQKIYREREGVLIRRAEESGEWRYGEAAPLVEFGTETFDACLSALTKVASNSWSLDDLKNFPSARHAVESLSHDMRELTGSVKCHALVSLADAEVLPAQSYKVKVGALPFEQEFELLRQFRTRIGADAKLRIDANQAWSTAEAIEKLKQLSELDIEFCEQPTAKEKLEELKKVETASGVAVAADESLAVFSKDENSNFAIFPKWVIVKPMPLGLHRAAQLAREAVTIGKRVVFTHFLDGPFAQQQAIRLASEIAPLETHGLSGDHFDSGVDMHRGVGGVLKRIPIDFEKVWAEL